MNYSPEQQQLRELILSGKSVASPTCAGAGKSSTARPLMNELGKRGVMVKSVPFMNSLYNEELTAMPGADVLNAHKVGKRMLPGRPNVDNKKVWRIAEQIDGKNASIIAELVGKLKCEAYGIGGEKSAAEVCSHYGIDEKWLEDALTVLKISDRNHDSIDFDDMIRFPVLNGFKRPLKGCLLVDEAQDYTPNLLAFISLFIGEETQGLILGDPDNQALQQFAGGDPKCFYKLAEMLKAEMLPLTYNFRCGKRIVENCNSIIPSEMKAAPDNPEGEIGEVTSSELEGLDENTAILCQMNSPLLSFVISCMEKNQPVQFRPGKLWEKCLSVLWGCLDTRKVRVGQIAERAEEKVREYCGDDSPALQEKLEWVKCVSLLENICLMKGITNVKWGMGKMPIHPLEQVLTELAAGKVGPVCMTGHTSKGLQWQRVIHINKEPKPRPDKIVMPWEQHQWRCVRYVILTRAIERFDSLMG